MNEEYKEVNENEEKVEEGIVEDTETSVKVELTKRGKIILGVLGAVALGGLAVLAAGLAHGSDDDDEDDED